MQNENITSFDGTDGRITLTKDDIKPFVDELSSKSALEDFKVVCDESNNSPESIAQGKMNIDVTIFNPSPELVERMKQSGAAGTIRGAAHCYTAIDDFGFLPPPTPIKSSINVSWEEVPDALGYSIYTMEDIHILDNIKRVLTRIRKKANKRKAQRRARTGRR